MNDIERSYEIIKRIKMIKGKMHHQIEGHFKDMKLTGPQGMVVGTLFHMGAMKVSDLATQMGLSMSTISGILDRLEKSNTIKRVKSETDGRVIMVELSDDFKLKAKDQFKKMEHTWRDKLKDASEEDLEAILKGLDALERLMLRAKEQGDKDDQTH